MEADGFLPCGLKVWVWEARLHTLPGLYLSFWLWPPYEVCAFVTLQGFGDLIYLHI